MTDSLSGRRNLVRRLAILAALALFLGSAYANQHWHDADCTEHVCAVCVFSDAGGASGPALAQATPQLKSVSAAAAANYPVPASRPLEAHRPRAPPIS